MAKGHKNVYPLLKTDQLSHNFIMINNKKFLDTMMKLPLVSQLLKKEPKKQ